jgi:hypothetical protein
LTSGVTDTTRTVGPGAPRAGASLGDPTAVSTAIVVAAVPAADGGCAALLPWEAGTVLGRLLAQLGELGIRDVRVLTRPAYESAVREVAGDRVQVSPDTAGDLRAIAGAASEPRAGIVILPGEVITHREALAGLLKDPRVVTGTLLGSGRLARQFAFRVRSKRGHVISAASPYHAVHRPTSAFLGVLKVAAADRPALASSATRLAELVASPPSEWRDELARKQDMWRTALWRATQRGEDEEERPPGEDEPADDLDDAPREESLPEGTTLSPEDDARLREKLAAAPEDTAALALVGLVRTGTHVGVNRLRRLFWARPLSAADAAEAEREIVGYDEDKVLLDSAVKASDGFFTTFFVSTYSRYIARWAAHRGFTPNQVTTVSLFIGFLAAAGFATGERWGLIAGAVLLQAAFTTDCVDGQLARYTRTFSKLGAWLDSIFDRTKEYVCFAGLALGASRAGDPVWSLACAAITLQTARHFSDFSFGAGQTRVIGQTEQPPIERALDAGGLAAVERRMRRADLQPPDTPEPPPQPEPQAAVPLSRRVLRSWHRIDRLPGVRWVKKMAAFPIGERFAAISISAALFDPRVTFVVLLSWGGFAVLYTLSGRVLRSISR